MLMPTSLVHQDGVESSLLKDANDGVDLVENGFDGMLLQEQVRKPDRQAVDDDHVATARSRRGRRPG